LAIFVFLYLVLNSENELATLASHRSHDRQTNRQTDNTSTRYVAFKEGRIIKVK